MMLVGVVCCQRVNRCLRQLLYIYEVGVIFPLRCLSPDLSSQYVEWRRPPQPVYTLDHVAYVQILTWFFDSHSTLCPFSVHRMARKELGKDVEPWFGPSAAVGAIRCLYHHRVVACMLTFLSNPGWKAYQKHCSASLSPSTARSFRWTCIRHHIRPLNLIVLASYRDGEGVVSSYSSVYGLE